MSNIGWHRLPQNVVVNKKNPIEKPEQLKHYEQIKVEADASDGQREFARRYNNMRKKLLDNDLMEVK